MRSLDELKQDKRIMWIKCEHCGSAAFVESKGRKLERIIRVRKDAND